MAVCSLMCVIVYVYQNSYIYSCPLGKKVCLGESDGYVALLLHWADIQMVGKYPGVAVGRYNLSHCAGPEYELNQQTGGTEREKEMSK